MANVSLWERLAYRTYLIAQGGILGLLLLGLWLWNGLSLLDVGIVFAGLVASTVFLLIRMTRPSKAVRDQEALQRAICNGQKFTLIELYGKYCTGCISIKPVVDQIETDIPSHLQVLRLDVEQSPGIYLKRGKRVFTPTFLLFDPEGRIIKETYMVLDRAKILYEVEQSQRAA